jgi:hypothetical protein
MIQLGFDAVSGDDRMIFACTNSVGVVDEEPVR